MLPQSGRTSGTTMTFTNSAGQQVASFQRPSSADVWGCDGRLRRGWSTGQWDAFATSRQHGERECRNSAFHEKLHGPRIYTLAAVPGSRYQRSRREVTQASGSRFGGLC